VSVIAGLDPAIQLRNAVENPDARLKAGQDVHPSDRNAL